MWTANVSAPTVCRWQLVFEDIQMYSKKSGVILQEIYFTIYIWRANIVDTAWGLALWGGGVGHCRAVNGIRVRQHHANLIQMTAWGIVFTHVINATALYREGEGGQNSTVHVIDNKQYAIFCFFQSQPQYFLRHNSSQLCSLALDIIYNTHEDSTRGSQLRNIQWCDGAHLFTSSSDSSWHMHHTITPAGAMNGGGATAT
jgi:hypothetical protein